MQPSYQRGQHSAQPQGPGSAAPEQSEEVLVADARGGLTPADQVEGKLLDLLYGAAVGQPRGSAEPGSAGGRMPGQRPGRPLH